MKANLATAHLEKAFTLYYDLGSIDEADRARIITGISRGILFKKQKRISLSIR